MYFESKRLSEEQIKELYPKLLQGDIEAKKKIIESHIPLGMEIVKRIVAKQKEEVIEEMLWHLTMAVEAIAKGKFGDQQNVGGYISSTIWNRLKTFVSKRYKKPNFVYNKTISKFFSPMEFEELLRRFDDRERRIIDLRMEGFDDTEIAEVMGYTKQRIHQIRKGIQEKLNDN